MISDVISSMETESKESKRSHFLRFVIDSTAYDPVKTRMCESEAEAEEPTDQKAGNRVLRLVYLLASASDSRQFRSHKIASDRVISTIGFLHPTPLV